MRRIGAAIGSSLAHASQLNPHVYRICRFSVGDNDVILYLLIGDLSAEPASIARVIAGEPWSFKKVLVCPSTVNVPGWNIEGASIVCLSDAIRIDASLGVFAEPWRLAQHAGIRGTKKPGQSSPYQPMLDQLIEMRDQDQTAEEKVKTEGAAIRAIWPSKNYTEAVPGLSTVTAAIRKFRGVKKGQD